MWSGNVMLCPRVTTVRCLVLSHTFPQHCGQPTPRLRGGSGGVWAPPEEQSFADATEIGTTEAWALESLQDERAQSARHPPPVQTPGPRKRCTPSPKPCSRDPLSDGVLGRAFCSCPKALKNIRAQK